MNESGWLTLAAFVFLGAFGVVAFFSLRRNIRRIDLPADHEQVTDGDPKAADAEPKVADAEPRVADAEQTGPAPR